MMSRAGFLPFVFVLLLLLPGSGYTQGFGGKSKAAPTATAAAVQKARDKAIRAYDFQTEFPGASDAERKVSRAAPMKVLDEIKPEETKPSEWWAKIGRILGPILRVLGWVLLSAIVLALIYFAASASGGWRWRRDETAPPDDNLQSVTFDGRTVKDWLREAEAMAASGRYAEAVHFLLFSSFDDIRRRLNTALRPAWTSREILRDVPMRGSAQSALSLLVDTVESSEFAGAPIGSADFYRCRDSYAQFVSEVTA